MRKEVYVIIDSWIDKEWFSGFDGMNATYLETGETFLYGSVEDLSSFYGMLEIIRSLGFKLLYLNYK